MLRFMSNSIKEVNNLGMSLSWNTYLDLNKSQSVFENVKNLIIVREDKDEYEMKGVKVISTNITQIHESILNLIVQRTTKSEEIKEKSEMMEVHHGSFIGIIISLIVFISTLVFLAFLYIFKKYGHVKPIKSEIKLRKKKEKVEEKQVKRLSKSLISKPTPLKIEILDRGQYPVSPGDASVDFTFDFDEIGNSEDDLNDSGQVTGDSTSTAEINAFSTVENLNLISSVNLVPMKKLSQ